MPDAAPSPVSDPTPANPGVLAESAAATVSAASGRERHDVAVVLGSGWGDAAGSLGLSEAVALPQDDLPGFRRPTAAGHHGTLTSGLVDGRAVLVLAGRTHAYEGVPLAATVHGIRTALACGVHTVVLTNAAGGIRSDLTPGTAAVITDHLNMTGRSPLRGASFVDLVDAYDPGLRALARELDPTLAEGVYAMMPGPQYETPAEVRMLGVLGADLVGMSTVYETIAARAGGARVLGLSLVTNTAAGLAAGVLDHAEVLSAGRRAATRLGGLIHDLVGRL